MRAKLILSKAVEIQTFRKFGSSCQTLYNKWALCREDGGKEPHICSPYNYDSSVLNIDYSKSRGNILVDGNENRLIDLYLQNGSLPLGYNHANLVSAVKTVEVENTFIHFGPHSMPLQRYFELLDTTLLAVAPQGFSCVHICSAEISNPIVQAITVSAERYWKLCCASWDASCHASNEDRHSRSKAFSVLTFEGSQFADVANPFNTQVIPYPNIKHPSQENILYNRREEERCLEQCFETIRTCAGNQKHAMAVVVEPYHTGKTSPSPEFYNYMRAICKELNVAFIVNEIDTCMNAASSFWAHTGWNLANPPDFVIFGKKMVTSGFYFNSEFQGFQPPTSMKGVADQTNLVLLEAVLNTITEDGLFGRAHDTSLSIQQLFNTLEDVYPSIIDNVSIHGCFCDVTFVDSSISYEAETMLRNGGVHFGRGDDRTLVMRPSLILSSNHVHFAYKVIQQVLQKLDKRADLRNRSI